MIFLDKYECFVLISLSQRLYKQCRLSILAVFSARVIQTAVSVCRIAPLFAPAFSLF